MRNIAWLIILVGLSMHVLVPLHIVDLRGQVWGAMPAELAAVYLSALLVLIGTVLLYRCWMLPAAKRLDQRIQGDRS